MVNFDGLPGDIKAIVYKINREKKETSATAAATIASSGNSISQRRGQVGWESGVRLWGRMQAAREGRSAGERDGRRRHARDGRTIDR